MNRALSTHTDFEFEDAAGPGPEGERHTNPLLLVHRCLRGRYPLAAVLGVLLAAPCAVVGYMLVPPTYTSMGVVNIAPTQPTILYENELTERLSSFESFVQSQANRLRSERLLSLALSNQRMREAGWPAYPEGLRLLQHSTEVQVPRGGQDILLRVSAKDPKLARAAAAAILEEYEAFAITGEKQEMNKKIENLKQLRDEADEQRKSLRTRAYQLAEGEGTDDLQRPRESLHEQIGKLDNLIQDLDIALSVFPEEAASEQDPGAVGTIEPAAPTADELAARDSELAALLTRRRQTELELASLRSRFSPSHRRIIALNEEVAELNEMIEAQTALAAASAVGPEGAPMILASDQAQLRQRLESLREMRARKIEEAKRLGKTQLEIDRLREEAARFDEKFADADERYQALLIQQQYGAQGRISIPQYADTPLAPSSDRRVPLAGLGAVGGATMGVGAVALFGLVRPRYRYISDIDEQQQSIRIMGAIPDIRTMDDHSRELVGASVHQIRAAIDARLLGPGRQGFVHLITSAMAGEGKSTVTLRLAKSFAISGKRTLVIDADLVGRKATAKFAMRGAPGFADAALDGLDPLALVRETDQANLSILPAGSPGSLLPERVSASSAGRVLGVLCEHYDAVLIDSGPILGSIEAQAIVPISDEVLLVVSRGTGVRLVRLAIDRVHRLGAKRVGVVFNRATMQDMERSTSFSMTSQRVTDAHNETPQPDFDADDRPLRTADSA